MSKSIFMGTIAGVMFLIGMMFLASADAGDRLGTAGTGNTHAADVGTNHWNNPNQGNGSIGNCSKDGKFCWNIQIGEQNHWGFPIEYYGRRAARLIADGQIEWANMTHSGVMYLGVWARSDNRPFDCKFNVSRRQYHCQSH